jgi:hypothetical protein
LLTGFLLSQVPVVRFARGIGVGVNTLHRMVTVAAALVATRRYLAQWLENREPLRVVRGVVDPAADGHVPTSLPSESIGCLPR